ncbi:MAG: S-layer homology domain-containing protein [Clostridia bacterium]|nr:S-layer homology domain-containing protein [Clostridia bacterium]
MKSKFKIISFILILTLSLTPTLNAFAVSEEQGRLITGTYQYSAVDDSVRQNENTFLYIEDCFTRSSFLGCEHLEMLSIQAATASISRYTDYNETASNGNAKNIVNLLNKLEFNNIAKNTYYSKEKRENSMGVVVGNKTVIQDEKLYTLLAVIPRSAGYKQEWAGNFTIGDGDIHEGFKAARDEILRFVKQYINEYDIHGDLKVWIAGYSRGAAVADMLGGFFAGGGIEYFGEDVSITPEDVYCYTIGTPKTVKDGLNKNIELSVSGNRDEEEYSDDTVGEAFYYTHGGILDVDDDIYNGLRNIISPLDSFPLMPPEEYGFTYYGNVINVNDGLGAEEDWLAELENISASVYNAYTEDGEIKPFTMKTFDLKSLSTVETGDTMLSSDFFKGRLDGLLEKVESNVEYKEHYEDALRAIIGTYGMSATFINSGLPTENIGTGDAILTLVFTYLDYASNCLIEEGRADDENEAVQMALKDLVEYLFDEEIDLSTSTVDDFFAIVTKYLAENLDEEIGKKAVNGLVNAIPEDYVGLASSVFCRFHKDNSDENPVPLEDGIKEFIKACYYGPDPESAVAVDVAGPSEVRTSLYMILCMTLGSDYPEVAEILYDEENGMGQKLFKDAIDMLYQRLMLVKDDEGEVIKEYQSLSEASDDKLVNLLTAALEEPIETSKKLFGTDYKHDFENQFNSLCDNITKAREILSILFFYSESGFNTEDAVTNATTLISNITQIVVEHFDEIYLAKARNSNRYEAHIVLHNIAFELNDGRFDADFVNPSVVIDNDVVVKPDNPTRNRYRFVCWCTDEDLTTEFDFSTPITEDTILYAKWKKKPSSSSSSSSTTSTSNTESNTTASVKEDNKQTENKEVDTKTTEINENTNVLVNDDSLVPIENSVTEEIDSNLGTEENVVNPVTEETQDVPVFTNVSEWAKTTVIQANSKNLIPKAVESKDFTKPITRAEFAACTVKLYEKLVGEEVQKVDINPFTDVDDEYVLKAYSIGITQGTSKTTFTPNAEITREQMATMIVNVFKKLGNDVDTDFEDVKFADDNEMHEWGKQGIYFLAKQGIISGVGGNKYNPLGKAKVEEALAVTLRCTNLFNK